MSASRDVIQQAFQHLTRRQVAEIRAYLHKTRRPDGTHLVSDAQRMADKYGVEFRTIRLVWQSRPGGSHEDLRSRWRLNKPL